MEEASGSDDRPVSCFPWDALPPHLQDRILSLLPVPALLVCAAVSRPLRSAIRSQPFISSYHPSRGPPDPFFLLFSLSRSPLAAAPAAAFRPSSRRWLRLPLPLPLAASRPLAAAGPFLLFSLPRGGMLVSSPLSPSISRPVPPMPGRFLHYVLALIPRGSAHYAILAVETAHRVNTQLFDSGTGKWAAAAPFEGRFAVLGDASPCLDGLVYCLSRGPDHLLAFDQAGGAWNVVDVAVPPLVCPRILAYGNGLFLVGGVEEVGEMARIGVWELDRAEKQWRTVCYMPEEVFREFRGERLDSFETVDGKGLVCFYNHRESLVLMFDLERRRWWWPPRCDIPMNNGWCWLGFAIDPHADLLR